MRKIKLTLSLLVVIFALISCSNDEGNSSDLKIKINPPSWIQGTWMFKGSIVDMGWRFTSNDVIMIQAGGGEVSQRGQLEISSKSGQDVSANDESTETTYSMTANLPAGQTVVYSFTKISDTEISWSSVPNSVYLKQ